MVRPYLVFGLRVKNFLPEGPSPSFIQYVFFRILTILYITQPNGKPDAVGEF